MLTFFHKHQKKFIAIVIVIVGISGLGIGWKRSPGETKYSNRVVYKSKSGRKYTDHEFAVLRKFFVYEAYPFPGDPNAWNFLNEGLLTERFLTNKVGERVFLQTYAKGFPKNTWERHYQSYRRFDAPFVSAEEVWKASAPRLYEAFQRLQDADDLVSPEAFIARVRLFLEEKKFPHYVLKQMLEYRRKMFNLPEDQGLLVSKDLQLFGYKHIGDWFGEDYVQEALKIFLNFIDEQKRHVAMPSMREARQDFYDKARRAYHRIQPQVADPAYSFDYFVQAYFHFLDVSESEFLRLYREILLCKRAFLLLDGMVAFDYQPLQAFFTMGKDTTTVELVKLPKEYQFKAQDDLAAFETYLHLVCPPKQHPLEIPTKFRPVAAIKELEPKLVGQRFSLRYQTIELKKLEHTIPMAEVYRWYQDSDNFDLLLQEFPQMEGCSSSKDFYKLKPAFVDSLHSFVRKTILRNSEERIQQALTLADSHVHDVFLSYGKETSLEGITDGSLLAEACMTSPVLPLYTQDNEHYYAFQVLECQDAEEVIPYREVLRKDLKGYLLETHGDKDRTRTVIAALKQQYPHDEKAALWQKRLAVILEEHQKGQNISGEIFWPVEKSLKILSRGDYGYGDKVINFEALGVGEESPVAYDDNEGLCYYRCLSHEICESPANIDKLFLAKNHLNEEVLSNYIESFINQGEN